MGAVTLATISWNCNCCSSTLQSGSIQVHNCNPCRSYHDNTTSNGALACRKAKHNHGFGYTTVHAISCLVPFPSSQVHPG
uniref:Uncharacterized protein n=1 Tax=Arundo donax TaxID=35708 RepID=A0A0A9ARI5_ARUDO